MTSNLTSVAVDIKAYNAVAVVGAGLSAASRLPLSGGLDALLWQAIDADPQAISELRAKLGDASTSSAKALLQRSGVDTLVGWRIVATHPNARFRFQRAFATLDSERQATLSPGHDALAQMLHRGHLDLIVSLNWDTQLEAAWLARYGQSQTLTSRLLKLHGDAANPDLPWVLPGEQKALPGDWRTRLEQLAEDHPRVLLIAGYSEADRLVVDELIAPLEPQWKIVRVGPTVSGPLTLAGDAAEILPDLQGAVDPTPETPGFTYVRFEPQHEFSWALGGRGLGPQDVSACPPLPEVAEATMQARATNNATIIGTSGVGKSLAAAQVAHSLWAEGWEVAALSDPKVEDEKLRQVQSAMPRPLVVILDDAQVLSEPCRHALLSSSSPGLCVLSVLNAAPAGEPGVRIDAERATKSFADFVEANRAMVLPTLTALDPHVGDGLGDESFERRLAIAREGAQTPWELAFILTGGWRRIQGHIAELRAAGDHDLVLGLIATIQQLRRGAAAQEDELLPLAHASGYDQTWLDAGLTEAKDRRLLVSEMGGVRLPHLRFSRSVLKSILAAPTRSRLLAAVSTAIDSTAYELAGTNWLLEELSFADERFSSSRCYLPVDVAERLAARCWVAPTAETGAAAFVLNQLRKHQAGVVNLDYGRIAMWVSAALPVSMPGISRLLNDLYNDDPKHLVPICGEVDTAALAHAFEAAHWPDVYFFGELFSRLGLGPAGFRESLRASLDRSAVSSLIRAWPDSEKPRIDDLTTGLNGLASIDFDFSLDLLEELAPGIGERWGKKFAAGYSELLDALFLIDFGPQFLRRRKPRSHERRIARKLCEALDVDSVATQFSNAGRRDWQGIGEGLSLIAEASPRHAKRIAERIDFDALDAITASLWADQQSALSYHLIGLALDPDFEPASSWIARHAHEMLTVDLLVSALSPKACASRLRELGASLDFSRPGRHWEITSLALERTAAVDLDLVKESIRAHQTAFAQALCKAQYLDEADKAVALLEKLAPRELSAAIAEIDPVAAQVGWSEALRTRKAASARVVSRMIAVALKGPEPMRSVGRDLKDKFPVAARKIKTS